VIEENIVIEGILFRLVDTAGIRESSDHVEGIGIQRSAAEIEDAGIVLFVVDSSTGFVSDDQEVFSRIERSCPTYAELLLIMNKADIKKRSGPLPNRFQPETIVSVSARNLTGLDRLRKRLVTSARLSTSDSEVSILITSARHKAALEQALLSLESGKKSIQSGLGNDLIAIELRSSIGSLGEIIGEVTNEDVLNNIFGSFCIGK
jgi:tRNA modification GTPase